MSRNLFDLMRRRHTCPGPESLISETTSTHYSKLTSLCWVTESPSRVTKSACQGTERGTRTPNRSTKSLSQDTKTKHSETKWRRQARMSSPAFQVRRTPCRLVSSAQETSMDSVPPTSSASPMRYRLLTASRRTRVEKRTVTKTLSLSMGTTTLAGPS